MRLGRLVLGVTLLTAAAAWAQEADLEPERPEVTEAIRKAAEEGADFGPLVTVESILVRGNSWTAERLIRRALLVKEGDTLRAGDPRFRTSRFRVLALGYFSDVALRLDRGSTRGKVILVVDVYERGTITLSRIFLGTSEATPIWMGLDGGDANFWGTGLNLSAAFVWAAQADVAGADAQRAGRLRLADPSLFGTPFGAHGVLLYDDASEPVRVTGDPDDFDPAHFVAFPYRRVGGLVGATYDFTRAWRGIADLRFESIRAETAGIAEPFLEDGRSTLTTLALGIDRDTRADPVLTYGGGRLTLVVEGGGPPGDYTYARVLGRASRWMAVHGVSHVLSVHLTAGALFGDAPRFERFYVGDWDRLITPRALDLVVSTRGSRDFFGRRVSEPYGELAGAVELEYAYRLFRKTRVIYGGDLFFGAGLFSLTTRDELDDLPFDLTFDLGLRLDTEIGVFELSLANGLGRIPL